MRIERNRNRAGRAWNAAFGAASILDGLIRVLSLGWLHSTLALEVSRRQARAMINRLKKETE